MASSGVPFAAAASAKAPAAPPRFIALFFDDTHSSLAGFDRAKHAAEKLIADGLQPGDRAGIFTGSGAVTLDFTADTKALLAALASMRRHPDAGSNRGFGVCPTLTAYQAWVITRHMDAMAKAELWPTSEPANRRFPRTSPKCRRRTPPKPPGTCSGTISSKVLDALAPVVRHLAAAPGTRILLMVSPGFLTEGLERQLGGLTDICVRDHIVVNALDDEGRSRAGGTRPKDWARRAARGSPGRSARWGSGRRPSPRFWPTRPPRRAASSSTTATISPVAYVPSPLLPRRPMCSAFRHPPSPTASITSSE